jgi:hypothetical protein
VYHFQSALRIDRNAHVDSDLEAYFALLVENQFDFANPERVLQVNLETVQIVDFEHLGELIFDQKTVAYF